MNAQEMNALETSESHGGIKKLIDKSSLIIINSIESNQCQNSIKLGSKPEISNQRITVQQLVSRR
jgi:hypothetical protein